MLYRPFLVGALTVALVHNPASASEAISVENLARLPALQSVSMSPDGKHLVALIPSPKNPDETALALWDTNALSSGPKVITPSGDYMKFIAASALKAGKVLAVGRQEFTGELAGCGEGNTLGATRTFMTKVYLTEDDLKNFDEAFASNTRKLGISKQTQTCFERLGTASLVDMLPLDPDKVIIRQLDELSFASDYFLYNLKTKDTELLFHGGARATPALFDSRTGKVLAKEEIVPTGDDYEQRVLLLNDKTGQFEPQAPLTTKLSARYSVHVAGIDDATGKYYVLTDQFADKVEARLYDPAQHRYDPEPAVTDKNYSIGALLFSTKRSNFNQVVGFIVDGPSREAVYVDPALKSIQDAIKHAFPGRHVSLTSYTDDLSKVLFVTENASTPPAYHLLLDKKQMVNLGSALPEIDKNLAITESWITYKARDGLEIPAILDLPIGWKQGDAPAPAIVLPHGGPWARDYTGWDSAGWVPLLISRGYAVLRPQYRGSAGLGRNLWLAGDKEWGLKMSDDNDDGAAWLVAQGIAAKDRIAIFGYSYGGFAAIAADVRSPSPFKCAIAGAPVANLGRLGTSWSDNRLQRILQGRTVKGMDPMQNTAKAHLPIMLFGGDRDVRVPPFHPRDYYNAVKDRVPAQYHVIADMPHSMPWYPRQQRETLTLIANYLDKDCGIAKH
ncbi:peptidase S9 [Rhodanobacter sp. PCA2]|nr:peptidase S9 [Rhodanobacter sp. PCA2]